MIQDPNDKKTSILHKSIRENASKEFNAEEQTTLNNPTETMMQKDDKEFLDDVLSKIQSGEIDLLKPQSLLNKNMYESLTPEQEQKVDIILQNLLSSLRRIADWNASPGSNENFQMISMLREVRLKKEALENEVGDVLKI